MPSFIPREKPIRKKEQLSQKEMELCTAIRKNYSGEKLLKFIDKYRQAQISLIKAKSHYLKEQEFQNKEAILNTDKLKIENEEWINKTNDTIIEKISNKYKI